MVRASTGGINPATAAGPGLSSDPALEAVFRPVRTGNAFEETVERLLQAIRLGVVGFGQRFPPERDLAARLGVSRVTLREAIRALQQAGYVEPRQGRAGGTFVVYQRLQPSRSDLRRVIKEMGDSLGDTLTFRYAVECGAAAAAASRPLTGADRDYLTGRLEAVDRAPFDEYRAMDTRFHLAVAELSGSRLLAAAAADARMRLNDLLNAIPMLEVNIDHAMAQHAAIAAAVLNGEPDKAREAVAEHLAGTAALLRGFLS
jgi:DNA-binding FadR family transcriptional regulator